MGLSIVAVFLFAGTMSTSGIVRQAQAPAPGWHASWTAAAGLVRHLRHRRGRRDQPRAVRPPRGRERAGRRLPHRVLVAEVRAVLPRRVHQHGHRLRAGHDAVPRRLAGTVADLDLGTAPTPAGGRCSGSSSRSSSRCSSSSGCAARCPGCATTSSCASAGRCSSRSAWSGSWSSRPCARACSAPTLSSLVRRPRLVVASPLLVAVGRPRCRPAEASPRGPGRADRGPPEPAAGRPAPAGRGGFPIPPMDLGCRRPRLRREPRRRRAPRDRRRRPTTRGRHGRRAPDAERRARHDASPARRGTLPGPAQGFGVTFAQIFRKVTTEQYPFEPR